MRPLLCRSADEARKAETHPPLALRHTMKTRNQDINARIAALRADADEADRYGDYQDAAQARSDADHLAHLVREYGAEATASAVAEAECAAPFHPTNMGRFGASLPTRKDGFVHPKDCAIAIAAASLRAAAWNS